MIKLINYLALLIVTILLAVSCSVDTELQNYFVDRQSDANFMAIDIPASILGIEAQEDVSDDIKEAVNSFKKINILILKKNDTNATVYEKEKTAIKKILSDEHFKDLMRFKDGNTMFVIKYLGDEKSVDQLIVFAYASDKGLALVRVLGDKLDVNKVGKLIALAQSGKIDTSKFKALEGLF